MTLSIELLNEDGPGIDLVDAQEAQRVGLEWQKLLKITCRIHTIWPVRHYLMSQAQGQQDAGEATSTLTELCQFYAAALRGCSEPRPVMQYLEDDYRRIDLATRALTEHLHASIGFPLWGTPDYETLEPLFFEKFHALAMGALLQDGAYMDMFQPKVAVHIQGCENGGRKPDAAPSQIDLDAAVSRAAPQ